MDERKLLLCLLTTQIWLFVGMVAAQQVDQSTTPEQSEDEQTIISDDADEHQEPKLREVPCLAARDCSHVAGSYCDLDLKRCQCKPDYPVTDTRHCYKESRFEEFCRLDIQCQRLDKNSRCNRDLNLCQCQPRYIPRSYGKDFWCVEDYSGLNMSPGSYVDPALFGIMGGLVLMFIVLCVVLQMFAKAQFRENRTIFNTPNPRLMNVSLMKDHGSGKDRKVSNGEEGFSNRGMSSRKNGTSVSGAASGIRNNSNEEAVEFIEIRDDEGEAKV